MGTLVNSVPEFLFSFIFFHLLKDLSYLMFRHFLLGVVYIYVTCPAHLISFKILDCYFSISNSCLKTDRGVMFCLQHWGSLIALNQVCLYFTAGIKDGEILKSQVSMLIAEVKKMHRCLASLQFLFLSSK